MNIISVMNNTTKNIYIYIYMDKTLFTNYYSYFYKYNLMILGEHMVL